jgi:two-component system, chemotaxis family, chemotaxis protein CheY
VLSQQSCLVLDDSDVVRKIMRTTIEGLGFQVDDAASTAEALLRCKRGLPCLLMLDWHVPGGDPLEFLAAIRSMPGGRNVKIIYVVTNNDPAEIGRAIAAGCNDYLIKPFYRVSLETKVAALTTRIRDVEDDDNHYRPLRTGYALAGAR